MIHKAIAQLSQRVVSRTENCVLDFVIFATLLIVSKMLTFVHCKDATVIETTEEQGNQETPDGGKP